MDTSTDEYRLFYRRMRDVCHALVKFSRYEYGKYREREEHKVWLALCTLGWHLPFSKGCLRESFGPAWEEWAQVLPLISEDDRRACHVAALHLARGGGSKPVSNELLDRIERIFGPDPLNLDGLDPPRDRGLIIGLSE